MWSPTINSDELYHHGILGMKWGVRRYQNPDGTLTPLGKKHTKAYSESGEYHKRTEAARNKVIEEGNKLIKQNKGLSRDFGGKYENVDDPEYFELVAQEYKVNTDSYWDSYSKFMDARKKEMNFNSLNKKSIERGKKIINAIHLNRRKHVASNS